MWVARTEDLLADIDKHITENQHWEMLVITHSDYVLAVALNETDEPPTPSINEAESGGTLTSVPATSSMVATGWQTSFRHRACRTMAFMAEARIRSS